MKDKVTARQGWTQIPRERVLGKGSVIAATTWTDVYEPPLGARGTVKFFSIYNTAESAVTVYVRINDDVMSDTYLISVASFTGADEFVRIVDTGGQLVVEYGQQIQLYVSDANSVEWYITGTEQREQQ